MGPWYICQPRKHKKWQSNNFVLVSLSLQACQKMNIFSNKFHSTSDVGRGSCYNVTTPYSACCHPQLCCCCYVHISSDAEESVLMSLQKFKQSMLTVLSFAAQTSTEHYLEVPASEGYKKAVYLFFKSSRNSKQIPACVC